MHATFVDNFCNPFSVIDTPVASPRFHAAVEALVARYNPVVEFRA